MVAGIVLFALGLKTTLGHLGDTLETVPAVALCGGAALYLLGSRVPLRTTGRIFRRRTVGAVALLALVPVALAIPALAALALVAAVCSLIVAYEVIRYRESPGPGQAPRIGGVSGPALTIDYSLHCGRRTAFGRRACSRSLVMMHGVQLDSVRSPISILRLSLAGRRAMWWNVRAKTPSPGPAFGNDA